MSVPLVKHAATRLRAAVPHVPVYEGEAAQRVEGTGSSVIEVRDSGPWGPTPSNARHRVLQINILSDRTRDAEGLPVADDADARCWVLWEQADALFNDPGRDWQRQWPGVHHARRADGPTLTLIPNGDGSVMLSARYEISHD